MPQQLKQFVENSKKQKEYQIPEKQEAEVYEAELDFGKHFLMSTVSSEDEKGGGKGTGNETDDAALNMSLHE